MKPEEGSDKHNRKDATFPKSTVKIQAVHFPNYHTVSIFQMEFCMCCIFIYWPYFIHLLITIVNFFGFSTHTIMSPVNKYSFVSFFPIFMSFISFSCLIVLVSPYTTEKSDESEHPFLSLISGEKAFSISSLTMLAVGFLVLKGWGCIYTWSN